MNLTAEQLRSYKSAVEIDIKKKKKINEEKVINKTGLMK